MTGIHEAPDNEHQKNWSKIKYQQVFTDLLPKLGGDGVKRLNASQDKFASQWLNVIPCKNLYVKLSNQQLRISVGFAWVQKFANLIYVFVEKIGGSGLHGLSCVRGAGRLSRHANLNHLFIQTLASVRVPSVLEPAHL